MLEKNTFGIFKFEIHRIFRLFYNDSVRYYGIIKKQIGDGKKGVRERERVYLEGNGFKKK